MKSFGNVAGRESVSGGSMVFMPHLKKRRIGRKRDHGNEMLIERKIETSGIEAGTAADLREMEDQSGAAEEMSLRAHDTDPKMQLPLQGLPGRKRTVAVVPPGVRSGNHPPRHRLTGILSAATDHLVVIGTGQ